jgi:hypothetical protein
MAIVGGVVAAAGGATLIALFLTASVTALSKHPGSTAYALPEPLPPSLPNRRSRRSQGVSQPFFIAAVLALFVALIAGVVALSSKRL